MFDRQNFSCVPSVKEIGCYIRNDLFDKFCLEMNKRHKSSCKVEFSKCHWEYGWNVKFKKLENLCVLYIQEKAILQYWLL